LKPWWRVDQWHTCSLKIRYALNFRLLCLVDDQ
jgi:hypothetical protein